MPAGTPTGASLHSMAAAGSSSSSCPAFLQALCTGRKPPVVGFVGVLPWSNLPLLLHTSWNTYRASAQTFTLLFLLHFVPSRLKPSTPAPWTFHGEKAEQHILLCSSEGSQHAAMCHAFSNLPYSSELFHGSHTMLLESPPLFERLI